MPSDLAIGRNVSRDPGGRRPSRICSRSSTNACLALDIADPFISSFTSSPPYLFIRNWRSKNRIVARSACSRCDPVSPWPPPSTGRSVTSTSAEASRS